ncbi:hypothetical protein [Streptomyces canus]|uniref:hypothetical protein n=1 Tax=Streptomyces canus TaxID=58343 RepID=UPI0027D7FF4E|nr:hypothetical protein [Streptomyces canus]
MVRENILVALDRTRPRTHASCAETASGRTTSGERNGCDDGTSRGTGRSGRPETRTRTPGGGFAGSSAAMLCSPGPAVTPRSSSSPSTTSASRSPAWAQDAAAASSSRWKTPAGAASADRSGIGCPAASTTTRRNAVQSL